MAHSQKSGRMRSDPRCELLAGTRRSKVPSDRKEGSLPNVPSEPTTTSILRPSLGHLLLVTMIFPYSKQLLQLVLDSLDVQQLSRAESASLLVLFSAREGYDARGTTKHYFILMCRMA